MALEPHPNAPDSSRALETYMPDFLAHKNPNQVKQISFPNCPRWASSPFRHGDKIPLAVFQTSKSNPLSLTQIPLTKKKTTVLEWKTPIIFSWSPSASEIPPSNFNNGISWFEGPNPDEWIACDRSTGLVRMDIDPFAPTIQLLPSKTEWQYHGYRADAEPFKLFVKAGLVPIDRDRDVVWIQEGREFFRAYRMSTLKADDAVVPDLVVGGEPPLTIWEYFAAVGRQRVEARAWVEGSSVPREQILPCTGAQILRPSTQLLQADPRLLQASLPQNGKFEPGQGPRFPLMPVQESALIQYIQPNKGAVNTSLLNAPGPPPPVPFHTHPILSNLPSYYQNLENQKRHVPESPLPALPSRQQRIHTIQTFNHNAAATFSRLNARQRLQNELTQGGEEKIRRGRGRRVNMRAVQVRGWRRKGGG
ncbi:MAG: hypothetical protein Q9225_002473 [Loekoesia sp. 1 TL-2023]